MFDALLRRVAQELVSSTGRGLVSRYELARACFSVIARERQDSIAGQLIDSPLDLLDAAVDEALLRALRTEPAAMAYVLQPESIQYEPEQVVCVVDPFAYLSHLTAMAHHGLTGRLPRVVYATTLPPRDWRSRAEKRMRRDLGESYDEFVRARFPLLQHQILRSVARTSVDLLASADHGRFKSVPHRGTRVGTVGQTFLDMLRSPTRCGGLYHVLDVMEESLPRYARLVLPYVDLRGRPIDKVRLGYLFEERCELTDPIVDGWIQFASRGGSRKLDASAAYDGEHYSERWSLSINV